MLKLEKKTQIELFSCKGKIMICGDLNSRVGCNIDLIEKEDDMQCLHLMMMCLKLFFNVFRVINQL